MCVDREELEGAGVNHDSVDPISRVARTKFIYRLQPRLGSNERIVGLKAHEQNAFVQRPQSAGFGRACGEVSSQAEGHQFVARSD